jgi:FkbM family methyltransferase
MDIKRKTKEKRNFIMPLFAIPAKNVLLYSLVNGGGVPGGHNVIHKAGKKPFITPSKEFHSIALRHSDVVVDIGAYVGTYSLICARFPVKQVTAYEPTPFSFSILNKMKLKNLKVIQAAIVHDDKKESRLFISKGIGVTNSLTLSLRKKEAIVVPAINYTKAIKNASIVKIDIEGGEYVLPIVQPHVRAYLIDFHPVPGYAWLKKANEIIEELKDNGYKTIVKPDFSCGWTRAGSWEKEMETTGECMELMHGSFCCGCGAEIKATSKALCPACYTQWSKKHKKGFELGSML